jgi:mycothiol synthase
MIPIHTCQLDIPNITGQQWADLLAAMTEFIIEGNPEEPVASHAELRQFLSQIPEQRDRVVFWLVYDGEDHLVGYFTMHHPKLESPDYDSNKDRIYAEPVVLAPYRRQGVGTQLLPLYVNYAQKVGATWIEWDTKFESGFRFSEKIGAIQAGQQRTNRLAVAEVDWDMMQRWVDQGQAKNPEVNLMRVVDMPAPDLLSALCDLHAEINRLQPSDDVEGIMYTLTPEEFLKEAKRLEAQKVERVILCTRQPDGTLSGLTNMYFHQTKPTHAEIHLTGVRREFQNHGLGKWLKATMMLDMRDRHPEVKFLDTQNFNNNRPMMHINDRMSFKLFEQYVFYKMKVADLSALDICQRL